MTTEVSARRTATRERLIDAALTVFAEHGVGGASVEHICDAAGFTRGAFYSNFDTKDDLCVAVLQRQAEENLAAARQVIAGLDAGASGCIDDVIRQSVGAFLAAQRSDRTWVLASSEMRLYAVRERSLREAYLEQVGQVTGALTHLLAEAAAAYGHEFTVPEAQVVPVLHAVYEHGAISAMLAGDDRAGAGRAEQLSAVLRSMMRPITA